MCTELGLLARILQSVNSFETHAHNDPEQNYQKHVLTPGIPEMDVRSQDIQLLVCFCSVSGVRGENKQLPEPCLSWV